ncbi:MAG: arsenate reductase ArsC [Planctomycetia bacterium]|nr:arsenate reductase ArsC [Planctomycetia bacterium]
MSKPIVLFLCTHNAARSQMAAALLKRKAAAHFDVYSAGSAPTDSIHPLTVRVMQEVGIDLSGERPKALADYLGLLPVKVAISVCARAEDKCPTAWPGTLSQLEWVVEDPTAAEGDEAERLAKFRSVRDQIDAKLSNWLNDLTPQA